ncbi:cell division protein FtsQ/DivIB [Aestuariibacter salexigens]|uniref:cell division protein FtsQ/DivIB n=1 Tax=Aestuariibacter salexigens TaxID=226010 RepID=UPI000A056214|nr:cell division protein FtsQ/DivIB [Aestuariibacter salexigens]
MLVIVGLVLAAVWVQGWLKDEQQVPVQRITFDGDRQHVDEQALERLIRQTQPGSFFELDVQQVHETLEQQPWVYRASVRKQWPNSLKIYLVEQSAVAHWNNDQLLNRYGDTFDAQLPEGNLPQLFGPGGSEQTALQGYLAMQSLLTRTSMAVSELILSERFAWQVTLDNGIKLNLGRSEFIDRLQRFIDVYPLLQRQERDVEYVDLRYDTGLAVGWQSGSQSQTS